MRVAWITLLAFAACTSAGFPTALAVSPSGAILAGGNHREPIALGESDWTTELPGNGVFVARLGGVSAVAPTQRSLTVVVR